MLLLYLDCWRRRKVYAVLSSLGCLDLGILLLACVTTDF